MRIVTDKPAAQGDMMIIPVVAIPDNAKPAKAEGDHYILAHSETGHHHVIDRARAEVFEAADDEFVAYIRTLGDDNAEIKHQRSFDTHESLFLTPGLYQVRRQREYVPEGYRRAAD